MQDAQIPARYYTARSVLDGAVLPAAPQVRELPARVASPEVGVIRCGRFWRVCCFQVCHFHLQQSFAAIAQQITRRLIYGKESPLVIGDQDPVLTVLE